MILRDYQSRAISQARDAFTEGARSVVIVSPCGCLRGDTAIEISRAKKSFRTTIHEAFMKFHGAGNRTKNGTGRMLTPSWDPKIPTFIRRRDKDGYIRLGRVRDIVYSGIKHVFRMKTSGGKSIVATADHRFLTDLGWKRLSDLHVDSRIYVDAGAPSAKKNRPWRKPYRLVMNLFFHPFASGRNFNPDKGSYYVPQHRLIMEAAINNTPIAEFIAKLQAGAVNGLIFLNPRKLHVHHVDGNIRNNDLGNLKIVNPIDHWRHHGREGGWKHVTSTTRFDRVVSIHPIGMAETYDIAVADAPHNFLANGIVVHNSGKTAMAAEMCRLAIEKSKRALWIVAGVELCDQAFDTFERMGVPVGMICASSTRRDNATAPMQVASIHTLIAREFWPDADLVIADECRHFLSAEFAPVLQRYRGKHIIGLDATPERSDGVGLIHMFDKLIVGSQISDLQRLGHLVRCDVITPGRVLNPHAVAQRPVDAYLEHAAGRSAIVYSKSVAQAYKDRADFEAAGVRAETIEAKTNWLDRPRWLGEFKDGALKVLINMRVLTEGTDLPIAGCAILGTQSTTPGDMIQKCGRVLRPHPSKDRAMVIDLVGATLVHGHPCADRFYSLEGAAIRTTMEQPAISYCRVCGAIIIEPGAPCPECGVVERKPKRQTVADIHLAPWDGVLRTSNDKGTVMLAKLMRECHEKKYKPGAALFRFRARMKRFPTSAQRAMAEHLVKQWRDNHEQ